MKRDVGFLMHDGKRLDRRMVIESYVHIQRSKHVNAAMSMAGKRKMLAVEGADSYLEIRAFKRNRSSPTNVKVEMKEAIESIMPLTKRVAAARRKRCWKSGMILRIY
jgi:hypothetical protein